MGTIERQIAGRIVDDALATGYSISVNDGGETTLRHSKDRAAIEAAMYSTDEDVLFVHRENGRPIGWVQLIWGNGPHVISDYSDNADMVALLAGAEKLADELEKLEFSAMHAGEAIAALVNAGGAL